ncbi:MAG: hypothetical protein KIT31_43650, partial [Deltaproteobacteria bacterium]|nr:hypothetical protein [Deltaproteobacteria bacterium]
MNGAFAEVVVALPVQGRYHYRVPKHLAERVRVGARFLVPFGKRKVTAVIVRADVTPPDAIEPVDLEEALDDEPALSMELLDLCAWIADYYEAPLGEVVRAALPAGSSVSASEVIVLSDTGRAAIDGDGVALPTKERDLLARVAARKVRTAGLTKAARATLEALLERGLVERGERRANRVRLRRERTAR